MPQDASSLPISAEDGTYVNVDLYPSDAFGIREVPIVHKDAFGRRSRVERRRVNQYQYNKWRKENKI